MDKKRSDNIADLRRQREHIRRISVGAMVAAGVFALGSCEGLTPRDAGATPPATATQITVQGTRGPAGAAAARRL